MSNAAGGPSSVSMVSSPTLMACRMSDSIQERRSRSRNLAKMQAGKHIEDSTTEGDGQPAL
jgi:hypothetical protein